MNKKEQFSLAGLAWGLLLITFGLLYFLYEGEYWHYWPVAPIVLGLAKVILPDRGEHRSSGLGLLGFGVWMLIGTFELFGLDYGSSWPIWLIFVGLGVVWKAIAETPAAAAGKEHHNGAQ